LADYGYVQLSEASKNELICKLTEELPVLRAKIALSQEEISEIIGVSRQTYSAIETRRRKMSWNTFLSLILLFDNNDKTKEMLKMVGAFPETLRNLLNVDNRNADSNER